MQKNTNMPFYLNWLRVAFTHSFSVADIVGAILGIIAYFGYEWLGTLMIDVTLWILTSILGGIVLTRLILAPYWIYKKQENTIETLSQKLKAKITQEVFVIESYGFEFGEPGIGGYPSSNIRRILRIKLGVTAIPTKRVESIQLELLGQTIDTEWQPEYVGNFPSGKFYYFDIPDSIIKGTYTVKLIAFTEGEQRESKPYEIEIPE